MSSARWRDFRLGRNDNSEFEYILVHIKVKTSCVCNSAVPLRSTYCFSAFKLYFVVVRAAAPLFWFTHCSHQSAAAAAAVDYLNILRSQMFFSDLVADQTRAKRRLNTAVHQMDCLKVCF